MVKSIKGVYVNANTPGWGKGEEEEDAGGVGITNRSIQRLVCFVEWSYVLENDMLVVETYSG